MSEQENTKLVQQVYANFKSGDIQSLLALVADDIQWQLPEIDNVPYAGKRQGRQQVAQFFASVGDAQDVLAFEPRDFIAQGGKVVEFQEYTDTAAAVAAYQQAHSA